MKLLFVCSGNICRSPMAERMSMATGDRYGITVQAQSAGTLGLVDRAASRNAVRVCRDLGIDLSDHRSQPLSEELVAWADWVLVMEYGHAAHIREYFADPGDRMMALGTFGGTGEIDDPVGRWIWTFRRVRKTIDRSLEGFFRYAANR